ncbi:hypothetical protein FDO65_12470 [Nakamurella flava]|uniref:Uncharacterized protein n=1 Tax=Nakamurella flava TaxID=2576308 RepID=A0A4U6QE74_9ACTN|nr:hypothetical protein [Nakamurella flava]TKV58380.1 hypothetical protein FDO65_12470 [Nakamurella flava]
MVDDATGELAAVERAVDGELAAEELGPEVAAGVDAVDDDATDPVSEPPQADRNRAAGTAITST